MSPVTGSCYPSHKAAWETNKRPISALLREAYGGKEGTVAQRKNTVSTQGKFVKNSKAHEENYLKKRANEVNHFRWSVQRTMKEIEKGVK